MSDRGGKKLLIDAWDQVPSFASEAEEQAWWDQHDFSDRFLAEAIRAERSARKRGDASRAADILGRARQA